MKAFPLFRVEAYLSPIRIGCSRLVQMVVEEVSKDRYVQLQRSQSCGSANIRYSTIEVKQVVEEKPFKDRGPHGEEIITPVDYGAPNPNGFEVDNLYCE